MKKILMYGAAMLLISGVSAQYPLAKGHAQINAGVGLSGWGMPVYAGFDLGIHKDMSVGAEFSFRQYREKYKTVYYDHSVTGIGVNWNYHFNSVLNAPSNEWDLYAGLNAGYYIWNSPFGYGGDHVNGSGLGAQVGFRYYFNPKFGINLEGGSGTAFYGGKLGITIKL